MFKRITVNPYPKDTYKYDFVEWWNLYANRHLGQEISMGILLAEATEIAHCAGTYGPPPKEDAKDDYQN